MKELNDLEKKLESIAERICDYCCSYPDLCESEAELDDVYCSKCPLQELF